MFKKYRLKIFAIIMWFKKLKFNWIKRQFIIINSSLEF